jgi:hypothetical protein
MEAIESTPTITEKPKTKRQYVMTEKRKAAFEKMCKVNEERRAQKSLNKPITQPKPKRQSKKQILEAPIPQPPYIVKFH